MRLVGFMKVKEILFFKSASEKKRNAELADPYPT